MESTQHWEPWNKGKLVGQNPPLKPKAKGGRASQAMNRPFRPTRCHVFFMCCHVLKSRRWRYGGS